MESFNCIMYIHIMLYIKINIIMSLLMLMYAGMYTEQPLTLLNCLVTLLDDFHL